VARWRDAVRPRRHAARLGDLLGDLGRGQHPAMARLRALGQLDLDHPDLLARRIGDEALLVEAALGVAAAEVAAADLPDEVAAELAVVAGDRALARVVRETPELGAAIERPDRVGRQRAEAHGRNVEDRSRVRLRAGGCRGARLGDRADGNPEVVRPYLRGHRGMVEPLVAGGVDVE